MKEINSIVAAYKNIDFNKTMAALATVVRVEGSSYRRMGARMLVLEDGSFLGGISGGCLEGDAKRRAKKTMMDLQPSIHTYDTTQDDEHQVGVGLGCNGIIDVLFTPLNGKYDAVSALEQVTGTRKPQLLITQLREKKTISGKCFLFNGHASVKGNVPPDEMEMVALEAERTFLSGNSEKKEFENGSAYFFEVIRPPLQVFALGGNYDVYPFARIAKELGWTINIVCNKQKAGKDLFAVAQVIDSKDDWTQGIDEFSAIILMSHDLLTDTLNLEKVLNLKAPYIAMLGPKKRKEKILDAITEKGIDISQEALLKLHSPAGLDIGANTPEEIALSIAAEITGFFSGRPGNPLREKEGSIHEINLH